MLSIHYNAKAQERLKEIAIHIAMQSGELETALNFVARLRKRTHSRLSSFPYSGQFVAVVDGVEYFKIVVERYTFVYKVLEVDDTHSVIVTDVIHGRQNRRG